eukprot:scaffold72900_cov48-Cyclotella_meneghiniana.AAC.1
MIAARVTGAKEKYSGCYVPWEAQKPNCVTSSGNVIRLLSTDCESGEVTEEEVTERQAMGERDHRRRQSPANWMDAMVRDVVLIPPSNICRVGACCNIRYLMTDLDHVLRHQKYFAMDGYAERKNSPREKRKTDVCFCVFAPKFILQWPGPKPEWHKQE